MKLLTAFGENENPDKTMVPGITASQMPPYPKERVGLSPEADQVVTMSDRRVSTRVTLSDRNFTTHHPHHVFHPLPLGSVPPPLAPAKPFFLPNIRERDQVDFRGYECYKRYREAVERRQEECDGATLTPEEQQPCPCICDDD